MQAVYFTVAVPVCAANEIIAAACRVDQGARSKLQWVGEIAAWSWQIVQGGGIQGGGCVGVLRIEDRSLAADLHRLTGSGHTESEIHGLLLTQGRNDIVVLSWLETRRFHLDRVDPRL